MKKHKSGFTLMEMLIVIAIIAIITAIVIPTFKDALTKAEDATELANARAVYASAVLDIMLDGVDLDFLNSQWWWGESVTYGDKSYTPIIPVSGDEDYKTGDDAIEALFIMVYRSNPYYTKEYRKADFMQGEANS